MNEQLIEPVYVCPACGARLLGWKYSQTMKELWMRRHAKHVRFHLVKVLAQIEPLWRI
jgi:hypothetical protein